MSVFPIKELCRPCEEWGLSLQKEALERLETFGACLLEANQTMNLTAITEPREVVWKHFYDSLLFFRALIPEQGARIIDVGTGAGFPGIVLLCVRPDLRLTLLDSQQKRVAFLQKALDGMGLTAETLHGRAEEFGQKPTYRERYDVATARAVAPLKLLDEYSLPFVRPGGTFVALKGPSAPQELQEAANGIALLGGETAAPLTYCVPPDSTRTVLCIQKRSQTPTKYPRSAAKMTKQPL